MADSYSFDVQSEVDAPEVLNAVTQANKEHKQRYDLKNSNSHIEFKKDDHKLIVSSADEFQLTAVLEILKSKLVKRGVSLKALNYGVLIPSSGDSVKQEITLQDGVPADKAKQMVKDIKATKLKVQTQIMDNKLRVTGRKKDELQEAMALLSKNNYDIHVDFGNFR